MEVEFKQLFCRHDYHIDKWNWTRPWDNEPAIIQYRYKCCKCGKVKWARAPRGSTVEEFLIMHKELMSV